MKKDTGLMLSEMQGPLKNLLTNLSGEHGNYWLDALKKMLRREEIPNPPAEVLKSFNAFKSREIAKDKIQTLINYIESIPAVKKAVACDSDDQSGIIDIDVFPNLKSFIDKNEHCDTALFCIGLDGNVEQVDPSGQADDDVFEKWCKNFPKEDFSLDTFCKELIKLGQMYEDSVPKISVQ